MFIILEALRSSVVGQKQAPYGGFTLVFATILPVMHSRTVLNQCKGIVQKGAAKMRWRMVKKRRKE